MKCKTCGKQYSPSCDYRQGRCPNHPPLINISTIISKLYRLLGVKNG